MPETTTPEAGFNPAYTFPIYRSHTGKIQYRTDRMFSANVANRVVRRGEVVKAANPKFTEALVAGGQFAHVAPDAPEGIPGEFMTDAERRADLAARLEDGEE